MENVDNNDGLSATLTLLAKPELVKATRALAKVINSERDSKAMRAYAVTFAGLARGIPFNGKLGVRKNVIAALDNVGCSKEGKDTEYVNRFNYFVGGACTIIADKLGIEKAKEKAFDWYSEIEKLVKAIKKHEGEVPSNVEKTLEDILDAYAQKAPDESAENESAD